MDGIFPNTVSARTKSDQPTNLRELRKDSLRISHFGLNKKFEYLQTHEAPMKSIFPPERALVI